MLFFSKTDKDWKKVKAIGQSLIFKIHKIKLLNSFNKYKESVGKLILLITPDSLIFAKEGVIFVK